MYDEFQYLMGALFLRFGQIGGFYAGNQPSTHINR